jgi:hypothetical protein
LVVKAMTRSSVLAQLPDITARFGGTKSALHLPIDKPVALAVLRAFIADQTRICLSIRRSDSRWLSPRRRNDAQLCGKNPMEKL